jgi:uncharacterized protein YabE (DUF348 family)
MKRIPLLILALALISCQPQTTPNSLRIIDGQNILTIQPKSQNAAAILAQVGLKLGEADKLYYNGFEVPATYNLSPGAGGTFQIRRAVEVTLITPDGQTKFKSAALTIGQAVAENGLTLYANDFLSPLAGTPLTAPVTITYRPARDLTVSLDGATITVKSSAQTVGQALAEAGIPLIGLDKSLPAESKPVPANGQIKIVRVRESFSLQQKSIPFKTQYQTSDALELDTQNLLRAGEPGLAVTRLRVRTEDGKQVSSESEAESVVRQPVDEIVGTGTKIVLHNIPGSKPPIQYWRAVSMYASWYSPCHSGTGKCSYGTASGLPVQRGVVAMVRANYNAMEGQRIYVPGYGSATIGDVGGGIPGTLWIDLAYADDDPGERLSGWVMVYFLTPVPANPMYVMQ